MGNMSIKEFHDGDVMIRYVRTRMKGRKLWNELYMAEGHIGEEAFFESMRKLFPNVYLHSKRINYEHWRKLGPRTWERAIRKQGDIHPMTVYYPVMD